MPRSYVPERGDLVWLWFDGQSGHEQAGRRPALVLSPASYNGKVGLGVVCPVTSRAKGYTFEVELPPGLAVSGVVLSDHVRSIDWRARRAKFMDRMPHAQVVEVFEKLIALLGGA